MQVFVTPDHFWPDMAHLTRPTNIAMGTSALSDATRFQARILVGINHGNILKPLSNGLFTPSQLSALGSRYRQ
eukprot:scaffold135241_cov28-Tisochrysis_lutea.AAC.2